MRLLRLLLRLLPRSYRLEFGDELLATAADQWADRRGSLDTFGRARFWLRQWYAVLRTGPGLWAGWLRGETGQPGGSAGFFRGTWQDVRHSARGLIRRPSFTAVAVVTLGLGVGASSAMFGTVNGVLLRTLPYDEPDDVVVLRQTDRRDGSVREGVSAANLRDIASRSSTLRFVGGAGGIHGLRLREDGRATSLRAWVVSREFIEALGVRPALGRAFLPGEYVPGQEFVVLLSHRTWLDRYGGDPGVVGRELELDGVPYRVVGVLPPDIAYPSAADAWTPRPRGERDDARRDVPSLRGVARLAPGASLAAARAELDRIARQLAAEHPDANRNLGLRAIPLRQQLLGDVRSPILLLMGAVSLVLLVAAANVAGLQLARGTSRAREYVLRGALGAGPARILRLVVTESALLAAVGCLLGVGLAVAGVELIRSLGPEHLPRLDDVRVDGVVLAFSAFAAAASALVAGIIPALRAARLELDGALRTGARGTTDGGRGRSLRDRLVVGEIAVALVLCIGAGLLVRSLGRMLDNELGFDPERRLALQVWAYDDRHGDTFAFFERARDEMARIPGVEAVGLTSDLPMADNRSLLSIPRTVRFSLAGSPAGLPGEAPTVRLSAIDEGYLPAMGIPLRSGRGFTREDDADAPPVVVVNEAFVRRHLPGGDPIGSSITLEGGENGAASVVGVVADTRREGFEAPPEPEILAPFRQRPFNGLAFVVKTAGEPDEWMRAVREAAWTADPGQAIWAMRSVSDLLADWTRQRRFHTTVLVVFAGLAIVLAGVGLYGLVSFSVAQRVNELGIRRALGGRPRSLLASVLKQALTLGALGVGIGLAGSLLLTRLLRGMLYEIAPFDLVTFGALSALVVAVSALAAFVPARRATRVDPMIALRHQ